MEWNPKRILPLFSVVLLSITVSSCALFSRDQGLKSMSPEERRADLYYTHGTRKLMEKDYNEALSHLLDAAKLNPNDTKIHNNLGMAYFFRGRSDKAIEHLKRSVDLDPKNSDARTNLGSIYQRENKYDLALKQYQEVLNDLTYGHHYRTYFNMALIFEQKGSTERTLAHLERSIAENSDYCPALFKLGRVYYDNRRFERAKHHFHEASQGTCHENPAPYYYRGMAMLRLQEQKQALAVFEDVLELFPATDYADQARRQIRSIQAQNVFSARNRNRPDPRALERRKERETSLNPGQIDLRGTQNQQHELEFQEYSRSDEHKRREQRPSNQQLRTPSF